MQQVLENYAFIDFCLLVMRIYHRQFLARHVFEVGDRQNERRRDRAVDPQFRGGGCSLCEHRPRRSNHYTRNTQNRKQRHADDTIHDAASPCSLKCRKGQFFSSITSVDLITADTVSPTLSFISSALRFVITLSIKFLPTLTTTCAITPPNSISTLCRQADFAPIVSWPREYP